MLDLRHSDSPLHIFQRAVIILLKVYQQYMQQVSKFPQHYHQKENTKWNGYSF